MSANDTELDDMLRRDLHPPSERGFASHVGDYILDNIFGIRSPHARKKKLQIPEGYEARFNRSGICYLSKVKDSEAGDVEEDDEDEDAANEHIRVGNSIPICSSDTKLGNEYGEGIYQYFDFISFLCLTNFILAVIAAVNWIAHFVIDGWNSKELLQFHRNFYISSYTNATYRYWFWTTIVAVVLYLFTFGPLLSHRIKRRFRAIGYRDFQDHYFDPEKSETDIPYDVIRNERGMPKNPASKANCAGFWRFFGSYFLFFLVLCASGIITLGFVTAQYYIFADQFPAFILVSVVASALNFIWQRVCYYITVLEGHYTWSGFNQHHTLKYFVWKLLNVGIIFLARYFVTNDLLINAPIWRWIIDRAKEIGGIDVHGSNTNVGVCELPALGDQFLTLILVDVFAINLVEMFVPWFMWKLKGCVCRKYTSNESDNARSEFDIAEEYLELLYRQFLIYFGTPFVPVLPILGLAANAIEMFVDRVVLLRIVKTPPPLRGSMRHYLITFLLITAVYAVAVFPYGTGWALANWSLDKTCNTSIFATTNISQSVQ